MSEPAIIVLSSGAVQLASRLKETTGGEIHGLTGRVSDADVIFENTGEHLRHLFQSGRTIIAIMASGALVRLLAPVLSDKRDEPPLVVVSEDGASIVPLLGGHHGANQIARFLAEELGAHAAGTRGRAGRPAPHRRRAPPADGGKRGGRDFRRQGRGELSLRPLSECQGEAWT